MRIETVKKASPDNGGLYASCIRLSSRMRIETLETLLLVATHSTGCI